MRRPRLAGLGMAIGLAGVAGAVEAEVSCPDQLSVQQRAEPPSGWSVAYVEASPRLAGVTIFDGPPANRVSLKYDQRRQTSKELILIWNLRDIPRSHYLLCSYDRTTAQISTALPPGSRQCEVVFDRTAATPAGTLPVKRMVCR
jgi:hypothetical protein